MNNKRTPEIEQQIINLARTGLPFARCAEAVGISRTTLARWREGSGEDDFGTQLDQAKAQWVAECHARVVGSDDVADTRWALERLDREHYGRVDNVQVEVRLDFPSLLPAEALAIDWKMLPDAGPTVQALEAGEGRVGSASVEGSESRCVEKESESPPLPRESNPVGD